ncbi:MAG: hypothetical protein ACRC7R_06945, partial [Sarcina sp.]
PPTTPPPPPVASTLPTTYNIAEGYLRDDADVDAETNLAYLIGGINDGTAIPNDGYSRVDVTVSTTGQYLLSINYQNGETPFRISVNGVENTYITPPNLNGIVYAIVDLIAGINKIKFHGEGESYAPYLGTFTVKPFNAPVNSAPKKDKLTVGTYNISNGFIENEARIEDSTNLSTYIGGPKDGASTLLVNVPRLGDYTIAINYRNGNRPLKISYNGIDKILNAPSNDSGILQGTLNFNTRENLITFHGDGINYAPDIGMFSLTLNATIPSQTYNISQGVLANDAKVDNTTNYVTNIGGKKDGSSTLTVNVPQAGQYILSISYIRSNRPFVVDVNGSSKIFWSGQLYTAFTNETVALNSGNNVLVFHGDGEYLGPDLGILVLFFKNPPQPTKISPTSDLTSSYKIYKTEIQNLSNGVTINSDGFLTKIGGPNNGVAVLNTNIETASDYILQIHYVCPHSSNLMKVDVNSIFTNTIYSLPVTNGSSITDIKVFTMPVALESGPNTIKFYYDKGNISPILGAVQVLSNINSSITNIATTNILFSGKAMINGNFIENMNIEEKDSITFICALPYGGLFNFGVYYVTANDNVKFKIDVNGINTGALYNFTKTKSMNLVDEQFKIIPLNLSIGQNIIKVYL